MKLWEININKNVLFVKTLVHETREKTIQNLKNIKDIIFFIIERIINNELLKLFQFNKTIIKVFNNHWNNYFYLKSLKNISLSLEKEKLRDSIDLKFLFTAFNNEIWNIL